jgi:hypothetical protein
VAGTPYSGGVPLGPDPELARTAVARLDALRDVLTAAEDHVLACLVVTGEPRPQRVLDDWLDQVADTLRALGERAAHLSPTLARYAAPAGTLGTTRDAGPPGPLGTDPDAVAGFASPLGVEEQS